MILGIAIAKRFFVFSVFRIVRMAFLPFVDYLGQSKIVGIEKV